MNPTAFSGARASPGGLHLGHYVGCFQWLQEREDSVEHFFLVADLEGDRRGRSQWSLEIARDCVAMRAITAHQSMPVRLSRLFPAAPSLMMLLSAAATINQNMYAHSMQFSERLVRPVSFLDFVFPLVQAYSTIALGSSIVALNNDNLRPFEFTRKLAKAVATRFGLDVCRPELVHGAVPRLLGHDGRKMSKRNHNFVRMNASGSIRWKMWPKGRSREWRKLSPRNLPDDFQPFVIFQALAPQSAEEVVSAVRAGQLGLEQLHHSAIELVEDVREPVRREASRLSQGDVVSIVEASEKRALSIVEAIEEKASRAIHANWTLR